MKTTLTLIAISAVLVGCTTFDLHGRSADEHVKRGRDQAVGDFATRSGTSNVREIDAPYFNLRPVPMAKPKGPLTLHAVSTPLGPLVSETARANGYSVVFADSVDVERRITVDLDGAEVLEGLRTLAYLAGYIAVANPDSRTVTVSDVATCIYKLPVNLFQQLQAAYKVGGDPVSNSGGSSSSGGAGSSSGSSSGSSGASGAGGSSGGGSGGMSASFVVSGQASANAASVRALLTDLAGKNADVMVSDLGIINVRANAQAQQRVHSFLRSFARDAMSQVEIEASVVEVSLEDQFQFGIDWSRIIDPKTIGASTGILSLGAVSNQVQQATSSILSGVAAAPSLTATFTTKSIGAVISALRQVTDTKVVSNPHILAVNNTPATFFDGTSLPYLGSITATPTASGTTTSTTQLSGSASYAIDGVSFSVQPSIIDANRVQITLVPVLSSVLSLETLNLGNGQGTLTAPRSANKQSYMRVMAESGKTLILGGIRYSTDQKSQTPAPFILGSNTRTKSAKEIVILMRATVLMAQDFDPLIGESL
jgi:MSHA biogenesis protein MshL